jgi:hypothetical protein
MPDYKNGKIYCIKCNTSGKQYIGSTAQKTLNQRLSKHKSDLNSATNCMSRYVLENNDYDMILLEHYPCNSVEELKQREQYYLDTIECVNKNKCWLSEEDKQNYFKNYYIENKTALLERKAQVFKCICGCNYTHSHRMRHFKTKKHLNFISSNNNNANTEN